MIPHISLKDPDFSSKVYNAACYHGFFYLDCEELCSKAKELFNISKKYFAQPDNEKLKNKAVNGSTGYVYTGSENLDPSSGLKDQKEAFNIRIAYLAKGLTDCFKESTELSEFIEECYKLCHVILAALEKGLNLKEGFFVKYHSINEKSGTTLRLLHYNKSQQKVRAGLHSDYGTLTLLFQDSENGLQIIPPGLSKVDETSFVDVSPIENAVVVNIADLFQLWTDSVFVSARHRVVSNDLNTERFSIAFFLHPSDDCKLDVIKTYDGSISAVRDTERKRIKELVGDADISSMTAKSYLDHRLNVTYE